MAEYAPFQQASIDKICEHFKEHDRVICADEAGLGKTYIARGVIERMAEEKVKNSIGDWIKWWSCWYKNKKGRPWTGLNSHQKCRVENFAETVLGHKIKVDQEDQKDQNKGIVYIALKAINDALKDPCEQEHLIRAIARNLPDLVAGYDDHGKRYCAWDLSLHPDTPAPFRVLYVCSNLAIADQNARRLCPVPQRSQKYRERIYKKKDPITFKADRLSILWWFLEKLPTPYLEIYPITAAVTRGGTPGTDYEKFILGLDPKSKDEDRLQCEREEGVKKTLNEIKFDLVIFDEFQNFGQIVKLCSKDNAGGQTAKQNDGLEMLRTMCKGLYGGEHPPKTLALSATPFHEVDFGDKSGRDEPDKPITKLDMNNILAFLDSSKEELDAKKTDEDKGKFLYDLGLFRNERHSLLFGQYGADEQRVRCSAHGLLRQAACVYAAGQGNRGDGLVRTVPDLRDFRVEKEKKDDRPFYDGVSRRKNKPLLATMVTPPKTGEMTVLYSGPHLSYNGREPD